MAFTHNPPRLKEVIELLIEADSDKYSGLLKVCDDCFNLANTSDLDEDYSVSGETVGCVGAFVAAIKPVLKANPKFLPICLAELIALVRQMAQKDYTLNAAERTLLMEFIISQVVPIQECMIQKDQKGALIDLIAFCYKGISPQELNKVVQTIQIPPTPLYRAALVAEDIYNLAGEDYETAIILPIFNAENKLKFSFENTYDAGMLRYLINLTNEAVAKLSRNEAPETDHSLDYILRRLLLILNLLPNNLAISYLPEDIVSTLCEPLREQLGPTSSISSLTNYLNLQLKVINHPLSDEFSEIVREWQLFKQGQKQQYSERVTDLRSRTSTEIPRQSDKRILRRIVQLSISPRPHVIDADLLMQKYTDLTEKMHFSKVFTRNAEGSVLDSSAVPPLKIHTIDDSPNLPQQSISPSEHFHFYTIGYDPEKDQSHKPVIIKLLGTDGDCVQQFHDFIDEAMYHDAIIVAFNYKLSNRPSDFEIVEQICHLTKHINHNICHDNPTRITLHGFSLGAAPAVLAAAALQSKDNLTVGVCHDRGFSRLAYPASSYEYFVPVLKRVLKKYHLELNAEPAWATLNASDKLMLASAEDSMMIQRHNRLPQNEITFITQSPDATTSFPMTGYENEYASNPAHLTRLRAMYFRDNPEISAEDILYQFAKQRIKQDFKVDEAALAASSGITPPHSLLELNENTDPNPIASKAPTKK